MVGYLKLCIFSIITIIYDDFFTIIYDDFFTKLLKHYKNKDSDAILA